MTRSVVLVFPAWMNDGVARIPNGSRGANGLFDDEEGAYRSFERVVRAVTDVAPLVEVERLGCIVLAARGPSRYFGGDESLARHLHELCSQVTVVRRMGGVCGVGIADSRFSAMAAAHLAASRGRPCVVASSTTAEFIDALPVEALARLAGVGGDTIDLFVRLGLTGCGAVRNLGEKALIDRFGLEGARVHRLVTASDLKPLSPGVPPADFAVAVDAESPLVNVHHVVATARPAIEGMVSSISRHGLQCVRVLVVCHTDHAEESRRIWGEPHGFSAQGVLGRLACQIDGWLSGEPADQTDNYLPDGSCDPVVDAPTTGIVRVEVVPLECREVLAVQPLLWGGHEENIERATRAVALASVAHESARVSVPQWMGGRDLATVYARTPVSHVDLADVDAAERRVKHGDGVAADWSGSIPRPSPAFVLDQPRTITVLDAQGNTVTVTGRHELNAIPARVCIEQREYQVLRMAGPWPVEERWWDPRRRRRHVRMQVLVRNDRGNTGVLLVGLENHEWSLLARYD